MIPLLNGAKLVKNFHLWGKQQSKVSGLQPCDNSSLLSQRVNPAIDSCLVGWMTEI